MVSSPALDQARGPELAEHPRDRHPVRANDPGQELMRHGDINRDKASLPVIFFRPTKAVGKGQQHARQPDREIAGKQLADEDLHASHPARESMGNIDSERWRGGEDAGQVVRSKDGQRGIREHFRNNAQRNRTGLSAASRRLLSEDITRAKETDTDSPAPR